MIFSLAFITGATSGIGQVLARKLAEQKIPLFLTGKDEKKLLSLKESLEKKVFIKSLAIDLADPKELLILRKEVINLNPDLVINCAGFGFYGSVLDIDTEKLLACLDVNGKAAIALTIDAVKTLKKAKRKGVVINISSAAAFMPFPDFSIYSASKALLKNFSEALDVEVEKFGIRVLTSCPGMVNTSFQKRAGSREELNEDDWMVMNKQFAAKEILWQIEKLKSVHTFHFPYRLFTFFSKFFPRKWLMRLLQKNIQKRKEKRGF